MSEQQVGLRLVLAIYLMIEMMGWVNKFFIISQIQMDRGGGMKKQALKKTVLRNKYLMWYDPTYFSRVLQGLV
ncbi:hypothetical protein LGZ99_04870 [Photorhabdus temperata]|uniref:Uncharacterized protein n=1 Tax=Photorhabdus temperata J3 TaxID=1389415 RepID=U7QVT6_PHOTE|nr:hypothetical protein [Photorhabdus temperata]ERT10516.1 hypothetical protein O185_24395 [Photorhabdus temperata J3]MCT8346564.1 hypothetical protein [Photorhabdus temperata]